MIYSYRSRVPEIGKDTYVSKHALVIGNVLVGDKCYIGNGAIIRGDYGRIEIGSGTSIEEGVIIHAPSLIDEHCQIGYKVTIGQGAVIHGRFIGDFAVIGTGTIVSLYSEIGPETIISEGSLIRMNQKIPAGVIAGGNPIKVIRDIDFADREAWKQIKQDYIDLAQKYLRDRMPSLDK